MATMQDFAGINPALIQQMLASVQRTRESAADPNSAMMPLDVFNQEQEMQKGMGQYMNNLDALNALTRRQNMEALAAENQNEKRKVAGELMTKLGIGTDFLSDDFDLPFMQDDLQAQAMRGAAQEKDTQNLERGANIRKTMAEIGSRDMEGQTLDDITGESRHTPVNTDPTMRPDFLKGVLDAGAVTRAAEITGQHTVEAATKQNEKQGAQAEDYGVTGRNPDGSLNYGKRTRTQSREVERTDKETNSTGAKLSTQTKNTVRTKRSEVPKALGLMFPEGYTVEEREGYGTVAVSKTHPNKIVPLPK